MFSLSECRVFLIQRIIYNVISPDFVNFMYSKSDMVVNADKTVAKAAAYP